MIERCGCCGAEYGSLETHAARDCARRLRVAAAPREHRPRPKRDLGATAARLERREREARAEKRARMVAAAVARARRAA